MKLSNIEAFQLMIVGVGFIVSFLSAWDLELWEVWNVVEPCFIFNWNGSECVQTLL